MYFFLYTFLLKFILGDDIVQLNETLINTVESRKSTLFMIYLNPLNKTQLDLLEEITEYKEIFPNITFGYLDIIKDLKILEYFKLTNINESGIIIYDFKNKQFYIEEEVSNITTVEKIIKALNDKKINWNTNSIIEKIFYLITGKRYGKLAKTYLSFYLCILSILFYTGMNIYNKRMERKAIEKRFKTK